MEISPWYKEQSMKNKIIRMLNAKPDRILLQMPDGMIVKIYKWGLELTRISGRRKGECKRINFDDMIILNDALKRICPNMHELEKKQEEHGLQG